jgi:hypothetical protein
MKKESFEDAARGKVKARRVSYIYNVISKYYAKSPIVLQSSVSFQSLPNVPLLSIRSPTEDATASSLLLS